MGWKYTVFNSIFQYTVQYSIFNISIYILNIQVYCNTVRIQVFSLKSVLVFIYKLLTISFFFNFLILTCAVCVLFFYSNNTDKIEHIRHLGKVWKRMDLYQKLPSLTLRLKKSQRSDMSQIFTSLMTKGFR